MLKYLNHDRNLCINGLTPIHPKVRSLWEWGNPTKKEYRISIILKDGKREEFFSNDRNQTISMADKFLTNAD